MKNKISHQGEVSHKILAKAIYDLHGCKAIWIESVPIKEIFEGETVWEGVIQVFDFQGHPTAEGCYAWSHELERSKKRRFFAVLHEQVIDSPYAAVKASIISQFAKRQKR
jgi:hypothetical protein